MDRVSWYTHQNPILTITAPHMEPGTGLSKVVFRSIHTKTLFSLNQVLVLQEEQLTQMVDAHPELAKKLMRALLAARSQLRWPEDSTTLHYTRAIILLY